MLSSRPYTFDRVVRIIIGIVSVIAFFWVLNILSGALLPFFIACLLAYIFKPFVAFNKKMLRCRSNALPIFLFLLEFTGIIALCIYLLIPQVIQEINIVVDLIMDYASRNDSPILPPEVHQFIVEHINAEEIKSLFTREEWIEIAKQTLSGTWTMVSSGVAFLWAICSWFIVLLYFFFILMDYDRFMNGMKNLIPGQYKEKVLKVANDVKDSMNRYFRGQTLVAFLVGVLFSIGFLIIDMPMPIVLGMFIGVLNLVPYLQLISLLPTTFLCIVYSAETGTEFWVIFALAMTVYIVVQAIQDLYLVPKIMGSKMGLNPAIILLSLSIWGTLLGFLGLIVALPLTSILLSYYNTYVIEPYRKKPENDGSTPKE